jgi:MoaA/NifB/PqqE/SkfB family radical SAM enzyme/(2Fe-2S) ferredoxin
MNADLSWMEKDFFVIIPSFECNLLCDHCQHSCSSDRKELMPLDTFSSCIDQALDAGWKKICLSGGEPFLFIEHIEKAGKICKERNAELIVQTNGHWGEDLQSAKRLLSTIEGITSIGFSIDKCHLKEIPIDAVLNAINAAMGSGISNISLSISYQTYSEFEILKESFQKAFPGIQVIGWPICPYGRAKDHPELRVDFFEYCWESLQRNCDSQTRLIPIVHPNGDLHPCYRSVMVLEQDDPLILGNINTEKIADLIGNVNNILYLFIITYGGGGLGYLLEDSPFKNLLESKHQGVCHFCHDVLSNEDVVEYLENVLNTGLFNDPMAEGLGRLQAGWRNGAIEKKERILICNGVNCGKRHGNYPIVHYLSNQLVEQKIRYFIDIELVDCLKACSTGPNLYIVNENRLMTAVDRPSIDNLVKEMAAKIKQC